MNYKLVPMDKSHLSQVEAIERACFSHPWSATLLEQELYNDMISLVVAEGEDGTVLGYGEVRAILDEGTLEKIAVAPQFRRQGVAEEILKSYLRLGQAHLAFLTLEVRESNTPAIRLYEKLGFREVGRRKNYYREEHEDALLMTVEFEHHD
ncbi:ribosomal protein S18-alanine N-acetyltransferase [Flavonifractor sp. HCP28S3_F3]|uniref:ribosomal protein S18-alanine N-acetyltransferase n=1 Tax=Flavonifractor sp. HCP28S3_F3 TaxID=3438939 RepID=UPI003F890882